MHNKLARNDEMITDVGFGRNKCEKSGNIYNRCSQNHMSQALLLQSLDFLRMRPEKVIF